MSIRYSKHLPGLIFLCDLVLLNISGYSANYIEFNSYHPGKTSALFIILVNIVWVLTSVLTKSFKVRRPLQLRDNFNRFMLTLIYHLLIIFGTLFLFKWYDVSRSMLFITYAIFFIVVLFHRSALFLLLDYIRKKGFNHRKIIIIGDENIAKRLMNSFADHPEYGYDLADFINEEQILAMSEGEIIDVLFSKKPDEIFICYKQLNDDLLKRLIRLGDTHFIKIKVVSDLMLSNTYARLVNYDNVPILHLTSNTEIALKIRILKRGFDIGFSSVVMLCGAPVFLLIYIITKCTSRGPGFYKQERIGLNEKPFYIYKFRSMWIDAEKYGPQLSSENDPRITPWGRIMRKTRLDELPQFWNVFRGDMSVVGPRPERQYFIERIIENTPNYKKLLRIKPGITSIGQVHYGYAENVDQMRERMRYDLVYLQNISLNSDLNIIMKTLRVMVQGKGK
jgi:exopolysaccharide biosynthesis polyprenyl glycosylphosphotransferase